MDLKLIITNVQYPMRQPKFLIVVLLAAIVLWSGCSLQVTEPKQSESCRTPLLPSQNYLFEVEYINHAWGYQHSGIVIEQNGEMFRYSWGTSSPYWTPTPNELYSLIELETKFNHNRQLIRILPKDTIAAMVGLNSTATVGSYSDTVAVGADAGAVLFSIYQFDSSTQRYQRIPLRLTGDYTFERKSDAATVIANWLEKLYYESLQ